MKELIKELAKTIADELKADLKDFLLKNQPKPGESHSLGLLTVEEASIEYRVHENTIRNWIKSGELQSERKGSKVYVKINPEKK